MVIAMIDTVSGYGCRVGSIAATGIKAAPKSGCLARRFTAKTRKSGAKARDFTTTARKVAATAVGLKTVQNAVF
jgi:hypothetical protein